MELTGIYNLSGKLDKNFKKQGRIQGGVRERKKRKKGAKGRGKREEKREIGVKKRETILILCPCSI